MTKILFVCHGNICRSPMAEFVMKDLVRKAGMDDRFFIHSMAATREELGNDMYPPAKRKLREKGIPFTPRKAAMMTREEYSRYDHIIGMDEENLDDMRWISGGDPEGKISLLLDWTDHPRDVADPWYTGRFEDTYRDVLEGCTALLSKLSEKLEGTDRSGTTDTEQHFSWRKGKRV